MRKGASVRSAVRRICAVFAWRDVWHSGVWIYSQNAVTGQRRATWTGGCYGPLNMDWLRAGDIVYGPRGICLIIDRKHNALGLGARALP
jgi:hypothetical protein